MTTRIDFLFGPQKQVLFTAQFALRAAAIFLLHQVLVDDIYSEKGPYYMTIWDTSSGQDKEIHTFKLANIPPGTKEAFASYNNSVAKDPQSTHLPNIPALPL